MPSGTSKIDDCAFAGLAGVEIGADPRKIFDGVTLALLVGARPRGPGMERCDLLSANGAIFTEQGKALNDVAADDVRIGVTGNPANTNALIAMSNAPDIPRERFSALTRLDEHLASDRTLGCKPERLLQGPVADALTHVGQIMMLRRLASVPVRSENYAIADIVAGRVGNEQAAPKFEFD